MSSARKKPETLCNKCAKQSDCGYKLKEGAQILVRCLDFVAIEKEEEKK